MKGRRHSLKFRIGVFFLLLACSLLALLGYNNYRALRIMRQQTYDTISDTVEIQRGLLADSLVSVETYLNGFAYDNASINTLESERQDTTEWFSALYRLQMNFDSVVKIQLADDFFMYTPGSALFVSTSGIERELRDTVCAAVDEGVYFLPENRSVWQLVEADGNSYLTRVLHVRNSYVGAVVSVDSALRALFGGEEHYFSFAAQDGTLLGAGAPAEKLEEYAAYTEEQLATYQFVSIDGAQRLLIAREMPRTQLALVALVPDTALQATTQAFFRILPAVFLGLLALLALSFFVVQRWIARPVQSLTGAIHRLRGGDMEARVDGTEYCTEFDEMNTAFNDMVAEIRTLKIGVYEEQLQRQNTEIEYLKLQVTPHFLINCLNTVYQLTDAGEPALTQRMVRDLSQHLRYLLNSGASVNLKEEMAHVENFIELSAIRYPGCIRLETDIDQSVLDATVIPLLVLNYVENTIKYEVEIGKLVEIFVKAEKSSGPAGERVCFEIYDTGRGFSPEMLKALENIDDFVEKSKNRHIGISNVFKRAGLILGEGCVFRFTNRPGAGAQINMEIPYIPY